MPSKRDTSEFAAITLMEIMSLLSTEEAARTFFERIRWPNGPTCLHCGICDKERIYKCAANAEAKIREGLYKCADCRKMFTMTVGTVMEDSRIPLSKWLIAWYMAASNTQVSALQIKRQLKIGSYQTAWFMCHRIRFALADFTPREKLKGEVEADETYIGGKARGKGRAYVGNKAAVVSMVERGSEGKSIGHEG